MEGERDVGVRERGRGRGREIWGSGSERVGERDMGGGRERYGGVGVRERGGR